MKISIYSRARSGTQAAFTQVELLALVVAVAMLAMLGLSTTAKLTNQTKIAQCSNNLRQLALSQLLYASDNSDKLPTQPSGPTYWPWDLGWDTGNTLNQYGAPMKVMYCPGTAPRFTPAMDAQLYVFSPGSIHVIGYALTLPNTSSVVASNLNYTITPTPLAMVPALLQPPSPSQRVLNADANLSNGSSYTAINGGFDYQGRIVPHLCPHLDGLVPAGGNVVMLDGHVEWRPFKLMQLRTSGSSPNFYW